MAMRSARTIVAASTLSLVVASGCSSEKGNSSKDGDSFPSSPAITNSIEPGQLPDKASEQMAFAGSVIGDFEAIVVTTSPSGQSLTDETPAEQLPAPHEVLDNMSFVGSSGAVSLSDVDEIGESITDSQCSTARDIIKGTLGFRKVLIGRGALAKIDAARSSSIYDVASENNRAKSESINYTLTVKPEVANRTGTSFTASVSAGSDGDTFFSKVESDFSINITKYFRNIIKTVIERAVKGAVTTIVTAAGGQVSPSAQPSGQSDTTDSSSDTSDDKDTILAGKFKSLLTLTTSTQKLTYSADQRATWSSNNPESQSVLGGLLMQGTGQTNITGSDRSLVSTYTTKISRTGQSAVFEVVEEAQVKKTGDKQLEFSISRRIPSEPSLAPLTVTGTVTRSGDTTCTLTITSTGNLAEAKQKAQEALRRTLGIKDM